MARETVVAAETTLLSEQRLTELAAEAYRRAAVGGADMRLTVDALEWIRTRYAETGSALDTWSAVDDRIGRSWGEPLAPVLLSLRHELARDIKRQALANVAKAFDEDPNEGWLAWLRAYAEAFCAWRVEVCAALAEASFNFPSEAPPAEHLRTMTRYVVHDRWAELEELLVWLAEEERLPSVQRARFRVYAAQVQLYQLIEPDEASKHLDAAEELAPDDSVVVGGLGEYQLHLGVIDRSREFFQRSISLAPTQSDGYALMGDSYERENDVDAAEEWYREAVRQKPGDSQGYVRLIRLFGRPELLKSRETEMLSLFQRAAAVDPAIEYEACLDFGSAYRQNERYDEAQSWYDRAIASDPTRVFGYTGKAYGYLEADDVQRARECFAKAIDVAPESFEGYWGMAVAAEQDNQLDEALEWYQQSLPLRPAWEGILRGRIGDLHRRLGRYREAEKELLTALRLEPDDQAVLAGLHDVVAECYTEGSPLSVEEARRILGEVRAIAGEPYEATYQNWLGNLSYHTEDYGSAIHAYRRAVELNPDESVYHSNLAGAWDLRIRPGHRADDLAQAVSALRRAVELAPDNPEYRHRLSRLLAERSLIRLGGEATLELPWSLPPIRLDASAEMLPLVLDEHGEGLSPELFEMIETMRERLRGASGVAVPGVLFRPLGDASVSWSAYVIRVKEITLPLETLQQGKRFCPAPLDALVQEGIPAEVHGQALAGAWIEETHWAAVAEADIPLWTASEYLVHHLEKVLRANLDQFVDHQQVMALLLDVDDGAEITTSPTLLTELVVALQALVREGVPITAMNAICREFMALARSGVKRVELVDRLRKLPDLVANLIGNSPEWSLYRVGPTLHASLERALVRTGEEPVLALPHGQESQIMDAVRATVQTRPKVALVVETPMLRPFVRALVEPLLPVVPVLSSDELQPEVAAAIVGELDVASA